VAEGSRALLERGARCVVATLGADGVLIDGEEAVPAVEVEVVDTTGCGDAFTAGLLFGLAEGRERRAAAELGCAVAARVAQGLGTDAGGLGVDA
jgi:sugar/nucleoside kinase (ribokinase family)